MSFAKLRDTNLERICVSQGTLFSQLLANVLLFMLIVSLFFKIIWVLNQKDMVVLNDNNFQMIYLVPPTLWITHQRVNVDIGGSVNIDCLTAAHPPSINYWSRAGQKGYISGQSNP